MDKKNDTFYINEALKQAKIAAKYGDIPVGCIVVYRENKRNKKMCEIANAARIKDGDILAKSYNKRNKSKNATAHAEIIAISKACKKISDFRLEECTMYVTLEPCQMCAGAIVQSRMKKLVIGARSIKSGSCGSIINIIDNNEFNHKVETIYLDDKDCEKVIKDFFKEIRTKKE
ncbi:MAG: nucleoside deaminase [Lachnospiraceae bacterium]|nr:nucleoside deaminase [Lachnospiraceae bacterium]